MIPEGCDLQGLPARAVPWPGTAAGAPGGV